MSSFIVGYKQVFFVIKSEAYCILRNICNLRNVNATSGPVFCATISGEICILRNKSSCILRNNVSEKLYFAQHFMLYFA